MFNVHFEVMVLTLLLLLCGYKAGRGCLHPLHSTSTSDKEGRERANDVKGTGRTKRIEGTGKITEGEKGTEGGRGLTDVL